MIQLFITFKFTESLVASTYISFLMFCCLFKQHVLHTTCFPQKDEMNQPSGAHLNHTAHYSSLSDDSALRD